MANKKQVSEVEEVKEVQEVATPKVEIPGIDELKEAASYARWHGGTLSINAVVLLQLIEAAGL